VTPNTLTGAMIVVGVLAAVVLSIPGVWTAVAVVALIQLQILLDCSDGELARWRRQFSPAGIYLDRFGHYLTETLLPIGLGIRADGGWDSIGGYTTLGLLAAVLALLVRTESALVVVARSEAGKPAADDTVAVAAPRASGLARVRRALGFFPFFRAFVAIEATILALLAAIADSFVDGIPFTRGLVIALVPVAAITVVGHLAAILSSSRLR
jgi:phosphatidylglycerophosphate synthase